jgi:hypothetical protein
MWYVSGMKESALEQMLFRQVRARGGIAVKLAPTQAGVPDRLILLPEGRHVLVELKADGGRVSPAQTLWHQRSAAIGHPVIVLRGRAEVDAWLSDV